MILLLFIMIQRVKRWQLVECFGLKTAQLMVKLIAYLHPLTRFFSMIVMFSFMNVTTVKLGFVFTLVLIQMFCHSLGSLFQWFDQTCTYISNGKPSAFNDLYFVDIHLFSTSQKTRAFLHFLVQCWLEIDLHAFVQHISVHRVTEHISFS